LASRWLTMGKLSRSLDAVVEDCVNGVGVDVNTASGPLLSRVSASGSCKRRAIETAPRNDTSSPGSSALA
jgi:uncharacterized protein